MTLDEFDVFVTGVVNDLKNDSKKSMSVILDGGLEQRQYDNETGYLRGLDQASVTIMEKARKVLNG